MNILPICGFAIISAVAVSLLRQTKRELADIAEAVLGISLFIVFVKTLAPFISYVGDIAKGQGLEGYFLIMLKALGISVCCKISSEICRDCGQAGLGTRVELIGKAGIILLSLPIIKQLLELAKDMLG